MPLDKDDIKAIAAAVKDSMKKDPFDIEEEGTPEEQLARQSVAKAMQDQDTKLDAEGQQETIGVPRADAQDPDEDEEAASQFPA